MKLFEVTDYLDLRHQFEVEVTFMHGDADAFSKESFMTDNEEVAKIVVLLLKEQIERQKENRECELENIIQEITDCQIVTPYDATSNGEFLSMVSSVKVYFYTVDGKKALLNLKE